MLKHGDMHNKKGFFTRIQLSITDKYLYPGSLRPMYLAGGFVGLLTLFIFGYHFIVENGESISRGALSSSHALYGTDCDSCHEPFRGVNEVRCIECHEKIGSEAGAFTYTAHYLYRSGDFDRRVPVEHERACFFCHGEHRGRLTDLTSIDDIQCLLCHDNYSFRGGHPEFSFAQQVHTDSSNFHFTHTIHINEIRRQEQLSEIERTCFYCHYPDAVGKTFQPLSFDSSCSACHLYMEGIVHRSDPLAAACQLCHIVDNDQIVPVQQTNHVLLRAEFDHSVHFIQVPCLDCHNVIPIREYAAAGSTTDPNRDHADILNLPSIQICRTCHTNTDAPGTCTTCHLFHPDRPEYTYLEQHIDSE